MKRAKKPQLSNENIEQMFRWIRQSISLMYANHRHPVPMTALIFAYMETFGKALGETLTQGKVRKFIEEFMHSLCDALKKEGLGLSSNVILNNQGYTIEKVLGDFYRNGLVHQFWMKKGSALFENKQHYNPRIKAPIKYVWIKQKNSQKQFIGINIDFLVPDFLNAINEYQNRIMNNKKEKQNFSKAILE